MRKTKPTNRGINIPVPATIQKSTEHFSTNHFFSNAVKGFLYLPAYNTFQSVEDFNYNAAVNKLRDFKFLIIDTFTLYTFYYEKTSTLFRQV